MGTATQSMQDRLHKVKGRKGRKESATNKLSRIDQMPKSHAELKEDILAACSEIDEVMDDFDAFHLLADSMEMDAYVESISPDGDEDTKDAVLQNIKTRAREAKRLVTYVREIMAFSDGAEVIEDDVLPVEDDDDEATE